MLVKALVLLALVAKAAAARKPSSHLRGRHFQRSHVPPPAGNTLLLLPSSDLMAPPMGDSRALAAWSNEDDALGGLFLLQDSDDLSELISSPEGESDTQDIGFRVLTPRLTWSSHEGGLFLNGQQFHLKGINWFGFETPTRLPHGLWATTMDDLLAFIDTNDFNAIRVPVSLELALNLDSPVDSHISDPSLQGLSAGEVLTELMDRAAHRGIMIMVDMHNMRPGGQPSELWYGNGYRDSDFRRGWDNLLARYKKHWNLLAIDLLNEPHNRATWASGNAATDFNSMVEEIAPWLLDRHPEFRGLVFVEGISSETEGPPLGNWGSELRGLHRETIELPEEHNNRTVYSPHTYGPSVYNQTYFNDPTFPKNLREYWDKWFGFARGLTGRAVVIGEWGGFYIGQDKLWQDEFAEYMVDSCLGNNFYWALNPNSGNTGGILKDDWRTPVEEKLQLLAKIQPHPTKVLKSTIADDEWLFFSGHAANAECNIP